MGEMADFALEQYGHTDAGGFDGFDSQEMDEYGQVISRPIRTLRCKHCDSTSVYWSNTEKGWRLFGAETRKIHNCPKFASKAMKKVGT